jgi:hypothetical protein
MRTDLRESVYALRDALSDRCHKTTAAAADADAAAAAAAAAASQKQISKHHSRARCSTN